MKKLLFLLLLLSNSAYGAVVVRYFAVAAAGAGDGTSHANRAALFDGGGSMSSVIQTFAFNGTDGLEARIETGTYTCTDTFAATTWTNPPTAANQFVMVGADSTGAILPNPTWKSCQPAWDTSTMPTINTAANLSTINQSQISLHMINLVSTGRTGGQVVQASGSLDWCQITASGAGTLAAVVGSSSSVTNCVLKDTATQYTQITSNSNLYNCRLEGSLSSSSGNRGGWRSSGTSVVMIGCTIINNVGGGIVNTGSGTNVSAQIVNCVFAGNGADAIQPNGTAAQTLYWQVLNCMITGNTGWGINGNTNAHMVLNQIRLRNNGSGDITAVGNSATDINITTAAGTDADEYVNAAGGDYRIKNSSTYWGRGYGVADQPAAGGGFFIQ